MKDIDFSEYTLISFGDSFTFGQDTVVKINSGDIHLQGADNKLWKLQCNEKSYTQVICDKMGFKNSLNFGVPGCSNDRSLNLLDSFLRQNPTLKVFVLFNFTATGRNLNILKLNKEPMYDIVDMTVNDPMWHDAKKYTGININTIGEYYTYFRNNIQECYLHIRDHRILYNMLSAYNVPHVTFDILNDMDARILRDNPIKYMNNNDGLGIEYLYRSDEGYVFTEMEFFESYYKELTDNTPLLSHIGIDYLGGVNNFNIFVKELDINKDNDNVIYRGDGTKESDYNLYESEHGAHWSPEGHIEVATVIEKYMNENYN
jgi:hypothetical protein